MPAKQEENPEGHRQENENEEIGVEQHLWASAGWRGKCTKPLRDVTERLTTGPDINPRGRGACVRRTRTRGSRIRTTSSPFEGPLLRDNDIVADASQMFMLYKLKDLVRRARFSGECSGILRTEPVGLNAASPMVLL